MSNVSKKNNFPISAHVARWLSGGNLYVEAEVFDRVLPQKSVLCHYHDQSKGEERGSGQQCLIFSVINPKCVSSNKFGYFCGRLSMDANQPSSYYFTHVLRRVAVDVCRMSKQIPLSALFQRSWNYTPMFDIDVKMSSVKFTDDILSNWGRLIISTVMQFYPGMKWRKGIPFLVCSRPMNQMEGTVEWSCAHCGSKEYNVGSSGSMTIIDCTKCGEKAAPQETTYYKLGAHFDFVQIRTEDCERLYQDIQTMEDGTKLVTGSSMVVNLKQMLVLREALVQKLVTMDPAERATYGLDKNQTDIFGIVDEKIYGSSKMADIPSSMCTGTNGSLRPCFVSKTRDCDCKAFYERYGNTGYDPDCAHCGGEGVRIWKERQYIPTRILDGEGNELPQFQARYSTSPGCDLVCDLLRLTSHHIAHDHRDTETPGFVLPEDFQGGVQAASDIEIGPEMTEKDRERNDCLLGVNVSKPSSTSMKRYSIDVSTGKPTNKKARYSKKQGGGELHFPESTEEGRKIRKTIEGIIKRVWSPHLQHAYVGNYCMTYTGAKDKKNGNQVNADFRTTYVVQVAGQGCGYCSNAKHCVCGTPGGPMKCLKCKTKITHALKRARQSKGKEKERWARAAKMLRWGMHRQQKSPLFLQIQWTGRDAVVTRKCRSSAIGLDGKACDACEEGSSKQRTFEKVTCTPEETVIFYPHRTAKLEQEKTQRKIQEGKNQIVHVQARNKQQQLNYLMHCQAMFASQFGNK